MPSASHSGHWSRHSRKGWGSDSPYCKAALQHQEMEVLLELLCSPRCWLNNHSPSWQCDVCRERLNHYEGRREEQIKFLASVPGSAAILLLFLDGSFNFLKQRKKKKNVWLRTKHCMRSLAERTLVDMKKIKAARREETLQLWVWFFARITVFPSISLLIWSRCYLIFFPRYLCLSGRKRRWRVGKEDNCCFSLLQDRTPWAQCCPSAFGWGSSGNGARSCEDQFCVRCRSCGR